MNYQIYQMLLHIKNWFLRNSLLIALSLSVIVVVASLINTNSLPTRNFNISDKILHAFAYIILIWSWLLVFRNKTSCKFKLLIFVCLIGFGIILELLQGGMMQHRTADWKDVLANVVGLMLGLVTFRYVYLFIFHKGNTKVINNKCLF